MRKLISACHICGTATLKAVDRYETFTRVTSDCKPWVRGGKLGICENCGCVQAIIDETWEQEATQIYNAYSIWHQSGGSEQSIFDASGHATARSRRILERLCREMYTSTTGRLLDIGCGNGSLLWSASQLLPKWRLVGTEFNDKHRDRIEAIPQVESLCTGGLEEIPGPFDLITLIHVFEHWTNPGKLLKQLHTLLKPEGHLLIQVPDYTENPFELLVADHCSHFSPSSVAHVVSQQGYEVPTLATDWVPREITVLAHPRDFSRVCPPDARDPYGRVEGALSCLDAMRVQARRISDDRKFGIFGTSIAGTWLYAELGDRVSFFVDEDANRAGKTHLGVPIIFPHQAPENSVVFIALPSTIGQRVMARLRQEPRPLVEYMTLVQS